MSKIVLTSNFARSICRNLQGPTRRCVTSGSAFRSSPILHEMMTVQVPEMGDSISEGTIVEWAAQVGQAVKVDDVVALVETDKVTVDIRAQVDGVIVQHFCDIEETVEVGSKLYEIDTEGVAVETTTETVEDKNISAPAAPTPTSTTEVSSTSDAKTGVRIPSIKFLGKVGWKERLSVIGTASTPAPTLKPNGSITLDGSNLGPMYGRMPFSEREIDALTLGGASEAPYGN